MTSDISAIRALIARQFDSLCWTPETPGAFEQFAADFLPDAPLYPAARPVTRQSVDGFVARMRGLSQTDLKTFHERMLGCEMRVFGNVAIASAACEIVENGTKTTRGVEMLLLVKDGGGWRIAAQAWDTEGEGKAIPPELLRGAD